MLEAINIHFRYGPSDPWILRGLSIRIEPGQVIGLSGPSGIGKSTLGRILGGFLRPDKGRAVIGPEPVMNGRVPSPCPVQMLFQHPELSMNPRWTGARIISEGYEPPPSLLEDLGLSPTWLERRPHELSGGELQRLAVARALAPFTRYIIADEMTAMLDPLTQAQIWSAVLGHARKRNIGVLALSHDKALLGRICDRIADMDELQSG